MATDAQIRAGNAQQILDNPVFQEVFDTMLDNTIQAIADCEIRDDHLRNQLGLTLAAQSAMKEAMFDMIMTAQLDAQQEQVASSERLPVTH
jgi:hypothetical protein